MASQRIIEAQIRDQIFDKFPANPSEPDSCQRRAAAITNRLSINEMCGHCRSSNNCKRTIILRQANAILLENLI
jgi:hypothetical protein